MGLYSDWILPRLINSAMRRPDLLRLRHELVPQARGAVLEIGMGSGVNIPLYGKDVTTVHGIEPSAALRKRAEQETRSTSLPIELYDVSAEDLPFDDNSYDTIVSTWTMCSIPLLEAALAEARRVLKPGGELLFVEHGRADSDGVRKWQNRLNPVQKAIGGGCNLNRPIAEQIETAGFDIQSLKTGHLMKGPKIATYTYMGRAIPK